MSSTDQLALLKIGERNELEALLMDFEQGWEPDAIDDFGRRVASSPNQQFCDLALSELVKVDLQRSWAAGHGRLLEKYLGQFPSLGIPESVNADLIVAEFEARSDVDPNLVLASYESRFPKQFPQFKQSVGKLLDSQSSSLSPKRKAKEPLRASIETSRIDGLRDTKDGKKQGNTVVDLPVEFGRYRILKELGAGAMGNVYLAHDSQLDRQVAIKTPSFSAADDEETVTRFYREARAAAKIQHRNICPIYDVGEIDGRHFISMAFVKGRCLSDFIGADKVPPMRTSAILVQRLATALAEAHHHNVIHRDLKPANIMIDRKKEPVVMDFGLARQTDTESRLTQSGMAVGTPAYMSPEQIKGDLDEVGTTADIYALGVILYELLTGQLPFSGPIAKVVYGIVHEEPVPPSQLSGNIDLELENICAKMMSKTRSERFQSMDEVAEALKAYLKCENRPPGTDTTSSTTRDSTTQSSETRLTETGALNAFFAAQADPTASGTIVEPSRVSNTQIRPLVVDSGNSNRNRRRWTLAGFAGGIPLLLGVIIYFNGGRIELDSESSAVVNVDRNGKLTVRPESAAIPTASTTVPDVGSRTEQTSTLPPNPAIQTAGSAINPKVRLLNEWQLPKSGAGVSWYLASLSPDGRRVAFRFGYGPMTISDSDSKQTLKIPSDMEDAISIAFSSDGRLIATGHDNKKIRLWDADSFAPVGEPFESAIEQRVLWVHLSEDGSKLIAMGNDHGKLKNMSTFYTWDTSTRKLISQFQTGMDEQRWADSIDASSDGRLIAVISLRGGPTLWDTTTGQQVSVQFEIDERMAGMKRITGMDLSADGNRLAYGTLWGGPSYAAVLDTSTGKELWKSDKQKGRVHCVQFTSNGKWLASTAGRDDAHQISLWDVATGKEVERWMYPYESDVENATAVKFLSFADDGSRLMLSGGYMPVVVWNLYDKPAPNPRAPIAISAEPNKPIGSKEMDPNGGKTIPADPDVAVEIPRQPDEVPTPGVKPGTAAANPKMRASAQRMLDNGGRLGFVDSRGWKYRLPEGEFRVNNIEFVTKCKLQDADVPLLSHFPELETLTFWEGDVTNVGFKTLANLKTVKNLRFYSGCGIGDEGLVALKNLDSLESLSMFHTNITNDGLKVLAEFPSLQYVMLGTSFKRSGSKPLTDDGLVHLAKIEKLSEASVVGPLWTDAAADFLARLTNIEKLTFGSPHITDAGIEPLGNLQHLRSLTLLTPKVTNNAIEKLQARLNVNCKINDKRSHQKYQID